MSAWYCLPPKIRDGQEFLRIDVDLPVVALDDEGLGLGDGLMRRSVRAESEARLGERRVPLRVQDLEDRLLDQAIQHGGDAHSRLPPHPSRLRDSSPSPIRIPPFA